MVKIVAVVGVVVVIPGTQNIPHILHIYIYELKSNTMVYLRTLKNPLSLAYYECAHRNGWRETESPFIRAHAKEKSTHPSESRRSRILLDHRARSNLAGTAFSLGRPLEWAWSASADMARVLGKVRE